MGLPTMHRQDEVLNMAIKKCTKGFYTSVEVCGGVCECASSRRCGGCDWNLVGTAAHNKFMAAMDLEYPLDERC